MTSWLDDAVARVRHEPTAVGALFPAVSRHVGREPVDVGDPDGARHGTVDDAARERLLLALPLTGDELVREVQALYRFGDAAEKRAVLRALPALDAEHDLGDALLDVVRDALRTNDTRLVGAALGRYATDHLEPHGFRHGVLKCLYTGIPLAVVDGLPARVDDELLRMVADYATERRAAGRDVPDDASALLATTAHPQEDR